MKPNNKPARAMLIRITNSIERRLDKIKAKYSFVTRAETVRFVLNDYFRLIDDITETRRAAKREAKKARQAVAIEPDSNIAGD